VLEHRERRVGRRLHPSPAMGVALVALVLAGTGGAGAAVRGAEHLVTGKQIKAHSITGRDLAHGSVGASVIAHGAVTSAALHRGAVTAGAIAPGSVSGSDLARAAVGASDIDVAGLERVLGEKPIDPNQIPSGAITTDKLADYAVEANKIDFGAVTAAQLADGSVTTGKLADGGVTTSKLANASVTAAKLAPLDAIHYIGTPGNPGFIGNADNCDTDAGTSADCSGDENAGYYVDQEGLVHLVGRINPSTDKANPNQVFALPVSLGPGHRLDFVTARGAQGLSPNATEDVLVQPGGGVVTFDNETYLDGIVYRPGE
jgi:hypothetical protein